MQNFARTNEGKFVPIPPPEYQLMLEKMAASVAKEQRAEPISPEGIIGLSFWLYSKKRPELVQPEMAEAIHFLCLHVKESWT